MRAHSPRDSNTSTSSTPRCNAGDIVVTSYKTLVRAGGEDFYIGAGHVMLCVDDHVLRLVVWGDDEREYLEFLLDDGRTGLVVPSRLYPMESDDVIMSVRRESGVWVEECDLDVKGYSGSVSHVVDMSGGCVMSGGVSRDRNVNPRLEKCSTTRLPTRTPALQQPVSTQPSR